jgi:hypothetical protein
MSPENIYFHKYHVNKCFLYTFIICNCIGLKGPPSVVYSLVSLARDPRHAVADSGPAEDGGFIWAIKIRSAHFLWRGSKAVGPTS